MLIRTHSEQETIEAGAEVGKKLRAGDIIACYGELGSGKTRFLKGVCSALGVHEHITSPTFTIINEYHGSLPVYHFDFYRISTAAEIQELGLEEYFYGNGVCLIEWAEHITNLLPGRHYDVRFELGSTDQERSIQIIEPSKVEA